MTDQSFGKYSFIIGVALAIVAGLVPALQTEAWVRYLLVFLGLLVGLLNITARESHDFLLAAVALLLASSAGALPDFGVRIQLMLTNIVAFVAPGALIVSLKAICDLAKS